MALPLTTDALRAELDWQAHFRAALEQAEPNELQRHHLADLRRGRDADTLRRIMGRQPPKAFEAYDPATLRKRTLWRIGKLRKAVPLLGRAHEGLRFLDLGAGRGEFLRFLEGEVPGIEPVGLDIETALFQDKKGEDPSYEHILFLHAPAEAIPVPDQSFDVITGYNSMEHFDDPAQVVAECLRVLRPGGLMYFYFGPPFNSPYGPHLQNVCGLPYFHHLFDEQVVRDALGISRDDPYAGKNRWSLEAFERLFRRHPGMECTHMVYELTWEHLWLAREFHQTFQRFEPRELVVRAVEVACRREGTWRPISRATASASEPAARSAAFAAALRDQDGPRPPRPPAGALDLTLTRPSPRKGDFTTATIDVPSGGGRTLVELTIENRFESSDQLRHVELEVAVNGRRVHTDDVARSAQPFRTGFVVTAGTSVTLTVTLRALADCGPSWQDASRTSVRDLMLTQVGRNGTRTGLRALPNRVSRWLQKQ